MRHQVRFGILVVLATAMLAVLALPAQAKGPGEHDEVEGSAFLTGPGLDEPIEIGGQLRLYDSAGQDDLGVLFAGAGLRPYDLTLDGWFDLPPDRSTLGPRYEITFTFADADMSGPIVQDVYPYAEGGRPWFFTHPGQYSPMFGNRPVPSAWWTAPASIVALLGRHGLPSTPPVVVPAAPAPASHPLPGPGFELWVLGVALTGLLGLLLAGVAAGRRRAVRTI